ncbi:MAG: hypothetical protein ACJ74R_06245 [Gaiellaceae bacterium]
MERGHAAAIDPRGGAGIQALRPARARLITGTGALVALAGAGTYATAAGGRFAGIALAGAIVSLVLLSLGLVLRWPNTIPWALVFAAAGYIATRGGEPLVDGWATVVGVLLLLTAELASWSIEHDGRIRTEPALLFRRVATVTGLCAAALLVNFILLAAAAVSSSAGIAIAAAGVAAAVTAVATVLRLVAIRGR